MQIINAYWGGYLNSHITLDKIPDYIDYITLSFAGPDGNNFTTEFLCSKYKHCLSSSSQFSP